jgi:coenzyme F420-reducing hydrogenase delta subunit
MEGECHFQAGNLRAKKRVAYVRQLLGSIGMEPDRVAMYNLSSGEGPRFAEISREMTAKIRQFGPGPVRVKGARKEKAA